ncbi:XRE family transcriptional regulator [Ligilactobacillus sp. WILCCON 0076]|uniref:XRE family transcriptional regulator n=1 Tax=Ligilactobacillus ubinensis TaxID=2876789 RepID=A0A9X2FMN7_9LACO|nr:XRE family transcriptional regulator [Ligilactobacillus ubinensis]MCP0887346.1 XRE family transcriptional regulator [Ligilactobacillus ubinensis]
MKNKVTRKNYEWSSEYVRSLRLHNGLTQQQVANSIGISKRTYISFELGTRPLKKETEQKIKAYFQKKLSHETKMEVIIDYLRVRIPIHNLDLVFNDILKIIRKAFVNDDVKRYGYISRYSIDLIQVYDSLPNDNRGILIEMSGQGCRQFEVFLRQQKRSWLDFLKDCFAYQANVTRIDIAVNDYKEALPLKRMLHKMERKEYKSKFKTCSYHWGTQKNEITDKLQVAGLSIYFGSMQSEFYMCFYQKNYEIAKKKHLKVQDVPVKNRYELRFSGNKANQVTHQLTDPIKPIDICDLVFGYIKEYVTFLLPSKTRYKRNWLIYPAWSLFLGGVSQLTFVTDPKEITFERTKMWLQNQVMPTLKAFKIIDDTLETEEIEAMIAQANLGERHRKMIQSVIDPNYSITE